jgi:serine/threonine protein kinase/tetratricopeptide (TPR) repeat protein
MQTGERVADRFVIRDLADRGASGAVYRATDLVTHAEVALKIIDSETLEEHFLREARVLEGLRHPTIVSYVAHGTTAEGRVYLALEWLDGETLSHRLREGPLSLLDALALTRAVADALAHAHAHGVVHRDVKPSNIFLTKAGDVKLIDFGIAQLRQATRITRTGTTMGTPAYMAPEQARAGKIDGRADIFSLGCVLYRCLAGVAPFQAENVTATLAKVLFEEAMPLRSRRREIPVEIDALVTQMLAKDPADRMPSAKTLLDELDRAPTELRVTSMPPSDTSSPSLTLSERRFVSVVLARSYGEDIDVPRDDPTMVNEPSERMLSSRGARRRSAMGAPPPPGGQIVRLVDGTLAATFGGADHVERAAHCALDMQKRLERGRVVMSSGLAVVEERLPLGEVIERAAQMLDRAPGKLSGIRLDAISARLLEARFDVVRDGEDAILLGERRARAQPRTLLGKPTPHVGRERELAALLGLVDECIAESSPRCAIVTGVAGLGKSRLASEVIERARQNHSDLVTWFARGDNMSAGSSFALTADLVREAVQKGRDEPARVVGALLEGVRGQRDDLASDPRSYGDRVVTACEDLVRSIATPDSPLLIVLDDLQWGDLATVRLIGVVMRNLQNRPLCVLAVARPDVEERFPNLWSDRAPLAMALSDLSPRAARKLVTSVLGDDVDDALVAKVVDRAAGNAFHLEELVRAVAEDRDAALPETVVAMVSTRMESLDAESRRLLRAASIFGETFWEQGVLTLLGESTDADWTAHAERLRQLVRQELVVPGATSQFAGDVEYRFRHAIVRDAAYAALTDADRAVGHRIAGEWLTAAGSNDARALAVHFDRGGVPERAAHHYLRAAQQSLLAGDVASVLDLCGRARAFASSSTAELSRLEAEAYFWQSDFTRAEAAATKCLAMRTVEDGVWWSCAALAVVACLRREGWERALPIYERMVASSQSADANVTAPRIVASTRVVVHLCAAGRFAEADKLMALVHADVARGDVTGDVVLGSVRAAEAMRALCAGDIGRYHGTMGEAAMLYERGGDLRNACNAECNVGFCRAELGVWDDAESILRASLARARRLGLISVEYNSLHNLGYVLFRLGRIDEARAIEEDCARVFEQKGDRRTAGGSRLYLAMMSLETGALEEARAEAEHALELLADTPPLRPYALAVLVFVHLAQGRIEEARAMAIEAGELANALGAMEQGEAYVRLAVAEALRAAGDAEGAKQTISAARARLVERGAIMSEAIRESFFHRVPENARTFALAAELAV